jgi:hypothetical protein
MQQVKPGSLGVQVVCGSSWWAMNGPGHAACWMRGAAGRTCVRTHEDRLCGLHGRCVAADYKAEMQSSCVGALFLVHARIAKIQAVWRPRRLVEHFVCTLFIIFLMMILFDRLAECGSASTCGIRAEFQSCGRGVGPSRC